MTETGKYRDPEYFKKYYEEHREHYRQHDKDRMKNPEVRKRINNANRRYRRNHPERISEYRKTRADKVRTQILEKYGCRCNNPDCPIPRDKLDPRTLQIDHVHNDGWQERMKGIRQFKFYYKVLADTEGNYQLLCPYCNWQKRFD